MQDNVVVEPLDIACPKIHLKLDVGTDRRIADEGNRFLLQVSQRLSDLGRTLFNCLLVVSATHLALAPAIDRQRVGNLLRVAGRAFTVEVETETAMHGG